MGQVHESLRADQLLILSQLVLTTEITFIYVFIYFINVYA